MFQINRRVDYAVRIMIEMGMQPVGSLLPAGKIAARTGVPKAFLHKITADLVKAELIMTQTGPSGGLALKKALSEINLLHIVEAIDGPVCLNICLIRPQECERDRICPAHEVWGRLQMMIMASLRQTTLDSLVQEAKNLRRHPRQALAENPYLKQPLAVGAVSYMGEEVAS